MNKNMRIFEISFLEKFWMFLRNFIYNFLNFLLNYEFIKKLNVKDVKKIKLHKEMILFH
jgi:hypothetical protein